MDHQPRAPFLTHGRSSPAGAAATDPRPLPDAGVSKPGTTTILIVDDQDEVRRMLATALTLEGHSVDEAANGAEGLERLKHSRYQLVLSDYAMPGGTGSWMLLEATRLGLLDRTAAVIITAHTEIERVPGVVVIPKPLDLDDFLSQLRRLLSTVEEPERLETATPAGPHRVELVLYVSSTSVASLQARESVERVLQDFEASQVRYTVHDLVQEPLAGAADRITFTPTLVRRYPAPRVWLLGGLRDRHIVADLLRACGVDGRRISQA